MESYRPADLAASIEERIEKLEMGHRSLGALYNPVRYGMAAGGKRLRPVLLLLVAKAMGEAQYSGEMPEALREAAMNAALGLEMFHNFTLLHDDVMDDSPTRRGRPSVYAKWGMNSAILSGDTMLTLATQLVSSVPDQYLRRVLEIFNDMALDVYEGQALDMGFEGRDDVTVTDYIDMVRGKTGALLGAAAAIGACLGGGDTWQMTLMYDFGMNLGIAFQIEDDYLDVYGDAVTFGKPIGGDIANGKKTYLHILARELDPQGMASAMQLEGAKRYEAVRGIYDKTIVAKMAREAILSHSETAGLMIDNAEMTPEGKEELHKLVRSLINRVK